MLYFPKSLISVGSAVLVALTAPLAAAETAPDPASNAFDKFFIAGGPLVWAVLLPLSLVTVALIIMYFVCFHRKKLMPPPVLAAAEHLLNQGAHAPLEALQDKHDSMLAKMLSTVVKERKQGRAVMEKAAQEHLEQFAAMMLRRIEWLNIIGNVAPMIGLFGTVWGMINAFDGIVQAGGQPEPTELAGGISVALVTTWWGLVIAIPALAAFGSLRNRIHIIVADTAVLLEDVIDLMETR